MRATERPSRASSRHEFEHPSRDPSRRGVNPSTNLKRPDFAPGLSSLRSTPLFRVLELHREEANRSKPDVELTLRDLAILQELDSHRYLDRDQIQAMFFPGPRNCQYRLQWLLEQGLLTRWRAATRPGRVCRASIYMLARRGAVRLAEWRDQHPEPLIKRAEHALQRRFHLIHQLEANQFFVSLVAATHPDGWGRLLAPNREVLIHVEWDRGTEQPRRLRAKLQAYVRYFVDRPHASANQILLVAPTRAREEQLEGLLSAIGQQDRECCRFWSTTADLLGASGPLGPIWSDGVSKARQALTSMPGLVRTYRRVEDSIGKPAWWLRRPAGGAGA